MTQNCARAVSPRSIVPTCLALSAALLAACEAPLELDAVNEHAQQAIQRTDFYQAMAANSERTLLVGNRGTLLASEDHGQHWQREAVNTNASFIDIASCPDNSFVALTFDNHVWHGTDQGWQQHALPSSEQMMTITCSSDNHWWVAGSFTTFQHSSDQGLTWQTSSLDEDAIVTNLQFLGSEHAVATAEYGMILTTADSGKNWQVSGYLPDEFYPHASYFRSPDEGWVGGLNGFIYHTRDGGDSWQRQSTDTQAPIFNFIHHPQGLFAVGDNATVLALNGQQWSSLETPSIPLYLRAVAADGDTLVAAGGRGLLLRIATSPSATSATNNK